MTKKLTITLSPTEELNITGWVNWLKANPQYIGVPRPPNAEQIKPLPDGRMPWQTRIVLEEMTQARYEEIAAQLNVKTNLPPWPQNTFGPVIVDEVPFQSSDSQDRIIDIDSFRVYALPLIMPAGPWNIATTLDMGVCEYQSPPTYTMAWFSCTAGEWDTSLGAVSSGTSAFPQIADCNKAGLVPNQTIFLNIVFWSPDLGGRTIGGVHRVRVGGHWPK